MTARVTSSLTGIGALTDYVSIDWTVKPAGSDVADTAALIRIRLNASTTDDDLLIINGATATTAANGTIAVTDATAGNITITLAAVETAKLAPADGLYYDVQLIKATSVQTMATGVCNVSADVTRAVT